MEADFSRGRTASHRNVPRPAEAPYNFAESVLAHKMREEFASAATLLTSLYKQAHGAYSQGAHDARSVIRRIVEDSIVVATESGGCVSEEEGHRPVGRLGCRRLIDADQLLVQIDRLDALAPTFLPQHCFGRRRGREEDDHHPPPPAGALRRR